MQYNGINLLTLFGKDYLAYGRLLLSHLFTKEEQKTSLFHKTHGNKSIKPTLDTERVQLLYGKCILRRTPFSITIYRCIYANARPNYAHRNSDA